MRKDSGSSTPSMVWQSVSDVEREQARRRRGLVSFWLLTAGRRRAGFSGRLDLGAAWLGLGIGALAGAVLGTAASTLLWVWPLLRAVWHWRLELAASGRLGRVCRVAGSLGRFVVVVAAPARPCRSADGYWAGSASCDGVRLGSGDAASAAGVFRGVHPRQQPDRPWPVAADPAGPSDASR